MFTAPEPMPDRIPPGSGAWAFYAGFHSGM